jgi:formate dehydrogenase subunit delta
MQSNMTHDEPQIHQTTEAKLVYMANQIADFFTPQGEETAVAGTADHIKRFWDPRMRSRMFAHLDATGGKGLEPIALKAVQALRAAAG